MRKCGIITLYCDNNFGNKLQNYATKVILESLGYECDTLVGIGFNYPNWKGRVALAINNVKRGLKDTNYKQEKKRERKISKFNDRLSLKKISFDKMNNYDLIVAGSDQIWNPYLLDAYNKELLYEWFFQEGINPEKKVALSASFSVDSIPLTDVSRMKKALIDYKYISVREERGIELIEELCNKKAVQVCDPTMVIEPYIWRKLVMEPRAIPEKPYVLCYFLGGSDSYQGMITGLLDNYEIIDLLDQSKPDIYLSTPENFLWYIDHASLILTDSFHAAIFSILFEKKFYVVQRSGSVNLKSRIDTLLDLFSLQSRFLYEGDRLNEESEIDYSENYRVLELLRSKFYNFLNNAISGL